MDWESIFTTLGATTIAVGALAWLSRVFISQVLAKDVEQFKSQLQLEAQKQLIEFGSLHQRRAELIAGLYEKLIWVDLAAQLLPWQLQVREYKREYGLDSELSLEPHEEEKIEDLNGKWRDMSEFYAQHRIYFGENVCELLDRFQSLTGFISLNYPNVAFKDREGNLYVSPEVKRIWDAAHEALPLVKRQLEMQFRELLGVK